MEYVLQFDQLDSPLKHRGKGFVSNQISYSEMIPSFFLLARIYASKCVFRFKKNNFLTTNKKWTLNPFFRDGGGIRHTLKLAFR